MREVSDGTLMKSSLKTRGMGNGRNRETSLWRCCGAAGITICGHVSSVDSAAAEWRDRTERATTIIWSSEYGFTVDALELYGDEGRGKLRKVAVRSTHPETRKLPNGVTRPERSGH